MLSKNRVLILQIINVVGARLVVTLGAIAFPLYTAKVYGAEGLAIFSLLYGFVLGCAIVSRFGMDRALIKYVSIEPDSAKRMYILGFAMRRSLVVGSCFLLGMALLSFVLSYFYPYPYIGYATILIAFSIPSFTGSFVLAGYHKGSDNPVGSAWQENGAVMVVASAALFCTSMLGVRGVLMPIFVFVLSSWAVFLCGLLSVRNNDRWTGICSSEGFDKKAFLGTSRQFFYANLALLVNTTVSLAVAGYFLSQSEFGYLKAAERVALIVGFGLVVSNSVFPQKFARLYADGNMAGLKRLIKISVGFGVLIGLPPFLSLLVMSEEFMVFFGSEFISATFALYILAIAQVINVSVGPAGYVLNMTGYEVVARNVAVLASLVSVGLVFTLTPLYGINGAAMGLALGVVTQCLMCMFFIWLKIFRESGVFK